MMRLTLLVALVVVGTGLKYEQTFRDTFHVEWTPDSASKTLQVCGSVAGTEANWAGIGFSKKQGDKMTDSDIVVGYMGSGKKPTVQVLYALNATGYPAGKPTMQITDGSVKVEDGKVIVCFTRAYQTGHHTLVSGENPFIWAHGPTMPDGSSISYHGPQKDSRCDDFTINWFDGPQ